MEKNKFVRLNVSIPLSLKKELIQYANDLGLNLTSALILILNEALKN